jgi:hypothetical protein
MKTGKLLLLLACLLVAMSATAAAYAPTNEPALGFTLLLETKTDLKEEVAAPLDAVCEALAILAEHILVESVHKEPRFILFNLTENESVINPSPVLFG